MSEIIEELKQLHEGNCAHVFGILVNKDRSTDGEYIYSTSFPPDHEHIIYRGHDENIVINRFLSDIELRCGVVLK